MNEKITIKGRTYDLIKRWPGEPGKSNTIVYLVRPKGRVAHIASEHVLKDGSIAYSPVTPLPGSLIR